MLHLVDRLPERLPHRMPHGLHVPRARQLDALEAELGDPMNLGDGGVDVAVGEAGETDVPVGIVAAELVHPRVVDAQHLVGRLAVVQLGCRRENAVDDLGVDAVAVHLLDAQVRITRPAHALLAVLVQTGRRHHVDARAACPARTSCPSAPTPPARPKIGAVVGDPPPPVRSVGDVRHAVLQLARRFRDEQVRREPDQIEVTVSRDSVVVAWLASGLACTAQALRVVLRRRYRSWPPKVKLASAPIARRRAGAPPAGAPR